jgi:hypothetical protein
MRRVGLVELERGADLRQQVVSLTAQAKAIVPTLEQIWQCTSEAARDLDAELKYPLSQIVEGAILALERNPFGPRIAAKADRAKSNSAQSVAMNQLAPLFRESGTP